MDPKKYQEKRDELIFLLKEALQIPGLPTDQIEKILSSSRKVQEDQFVVVLIGEFQGGKSTTFNALCDGREISPRGMGIKTSACVMSAKNISGNEEEGASVDWKTEREMLLTFIEVIEDQLRTRHADRYSREKAPNLLDAINLSNRGDLLTIKSILDEERRIWEANKGGYSEDRADQLRIARLITDHYGTKPYKELIAKTDFSIDQAGSMATFPSDWSDVDRTFSFAEASFIFISRINFRIRSNNLARTGSVVVDCPGLFASAYDTAVAQGALFSADAVWYLFNGGKQFTDGDLKALKFIKGSIGEKKLFLSMNARNNSIQAIKKILPVNLQKLKGIGFTASDDTIKLYDAFLALRSSQAMSLLTDHLDERTLAYLAKEAEMQGSEADHKGYWEESVQTQLLVLKYPERQQFRALEPESINLIRRISNLDDLLFKIEASMISGKARSILLDHGINYVDSILNEFEGALLSREKAAEESKESFYNQLESAKKEVGLFKAFCQRELSHLQYETIDDELYKDLKEKALLPALEEFVKPAAEEIYENLDSIAVNFQAVLGMLTGDESFKNQFRLTVEEIMKKHIHENIQQRTNAWFSDILDGTNKIYDKHILTRARTCLINIHKEWNSVLDANRDLTLIQNIETQDCFNNLETDPSQMEFESTLDISPESVKQMMLAALGNISNIVLAATAHPILGVLAFVLSRIVQEVWLKQETLSKIENSITEVFREQLNSSIRDAILPQLLAIRMVAISQIKHGTISKIEAELMRRHSATEIDFGKSQVERDQIATACRREREDLIVPLRMRMESFKAETEALI